MDEKEDCEKRRGGGVEEVTEVERRRGGVGKKKWKRGRVG